MSIGAEWKLFPPPVKQAPSTVGDKVFIRTKSAKDVGKKGVIVAVEKVVEVPVPAAAAAAAAAAALEPPTLAEDTSGGGDDDGLGTTVWREVKKQKKKKKKAKKWEDMRAVVRVSRGEGRDPFDCRARPSRLVPIYGTSPPVDGSTDLSTAGPAMLVLLTAETLPYRLLAASQVRPDDRVLEVGCSTGETTAVLVKYVPRGHVVALDVGAEMVERTKERLRSAMPGSGEPRARVRVRKIDPFLDPRGAIEAASAFIPPPGEEDVSVAGGGEGAGKDGGDDGAVDVVFIDIGGNREVRGVSRMIAFARTAFACPPRLIVVKSQALVAELRASRDVAGGGEVVEGDSWFSELLARSTATTMSEGDRRIGGEGVGIERRDPSSDGRQHTPKHFHPNKAPLRLSPRDGVTPICRYHNYHREGCKKGERCPFEHAVCHWCLGPGHVALACQDAGEFSVLA